MIHLHLNGIDVCSANLDGQVHRDVCGVACGNFKDMLEHGCGGIAVDVAVMLPLPPKPVNEACSWQWR
jgi:hypothetical protein